MVNQQLLVNLTTIVEKYFQVINILEDKKHHFENSLTFDPLKIKELLLKIYLHFAGSPEFFLKHQMSFVQSQFLLLNNILNNFDSTQKSSQNDKRFKYPLWHEHLVFFWIKEAYLVCAKCCEEILQDLPPDKFSNLELKRINFIIKQLVDSLAPSNFLQFNPQVIDEFLKTSGANFIIGLDNLIKDINKAKNFFQISTTNEEKFLLGKNIAATKGKVVFQNEVMQLIHYKPSQSECYSTPLLIVSPFINKYYILDLEETDSIVKWLVDHNINVFLISWINPNSSHAETNFADYIEQGPIAALDYICAKLSVSKVNCLGYCIGGTLLSTAASLLQKINDQRIQSLTLLTTLIDFASAGEMSIFIDQEFIENTLEYMKKNGGYLPGADLANIFSLLKSNDMIWPYFINNYLLGREPFPYSILYWNSDSIRIPQALHYFYLKNMYLENLLKEPNKITIAEIGIAINEISIPIYFLATKNDHIVPLENAFKSAQIFTNSQLKFVVADSGHVAGVINHPNNEKYSYWTNQKPLTQFDSQLSWLNQADQSKGSWWHDWLTWLNNHSGNLIDAKKLYYLTNFIEDAPGAYVKLK